jgi:PIN domain nuclease of toxin-antitoxin system
VQNIDYFSKLVLLYINGSIGTQTQTKPEPLENNLELLTISLEPVWALDSLPDHHKDPFDRLLIAQGQAATVYTQVWIKAKTLEIPLNPPWKGGLRSGS